MLSTDEIIEEYRSFAGTKRRFLGNPNSDCPYICPIGVDHKLKFKDGHTWYVITPFSKSLEEWLDEQYNTNYKFCLRYRSHPRWSSCHRYFIHETVLLYIKMKWI